MSFYAVLPFYALMMRRAHVAWGMGRRVQLDLLMLVALSCVSALVLTGNVFDRYPPFGNGLMKYFFWFALGMGAALVSAAAMNGHAASKAVAATVQKNAAGFWLLALALFMVNGASIRLDASGWGVGLRDEVITWALGGLISLALVLPAAFPASDQTIPSRVTTNRIVAWLGLISYGIFLWHGAPIIYMFDHGLFVSSSKALEAATYLIVSLAFSVPIAALSYYIVEKPFLKLKFKKKPA